MLSEPASPRTGRGQCPTRTVGTATKAGPSRALLRTADAVLAGAVTVIGAGVLLARGLRKPAPATTERPRLLEINSNYSLSALRARKAEHIVTQRDLKGYFDRVWSVHPLVGAHPGETATACVGPPTVTRLSDVHTMIEGKTRRIEGLDNLPYLNFALAQVELVLALNRIVHRQGVGIIRGDPYYNGLLALLIARLSGRRVELRVIADYDAIYETVGSLAHPRIFHRRSVEQRVARFTLSHADRVVTGSSDIRSYALRNGARPDRLAEAGIWSMISPIHLDEPQLRQPIEDELGLGDRPIVVCVSRLERMKHPEDVVLALAEANRQSPHIGLVLVGDGAMRHELEELSETLGLQHDLVFAGERDQRWIARLLAQSTVVAAPFAGLALIESALSGTPIVAYDIEWHAQLISSGDTGILVPYRDSAALGRAIRALALGPQEARRLGTQARASILKAMDPETVLANERALAEALLTVAPSRSS